MRLPIIASVSAALMVSSVFEAHCQDEYLGAEKLMQSVADELQSEDGETDPGAEVLKGIADLIAKPDDYPSKDATEAWISLFKGYYEIPSGKRESLKRADPPLSLESVFHALPAPDAWDDLAAAIAALPAKPNGILKGSLELVDATLAGDTEKQVAVMAVLKKAYQDSHEGDSWARQYVTQYFQSFETLVNAKAGVVVLPLDQFKADLAKAEQPRKDGDSDEFSYPFSTGLVIPKLTGEIDESEAEALIIRALKLGTDLNAEHEPTRRMIAKVMMYNPEAVAAPFWNAVETPAEIPLFEMLVEKFPKPDRWEFNDAQGNYLVALILRGDFDKARGYIAGKPKDGNDRLSLDYEPIVAQGDAVALERSMEFFEKLLKEDPAYPFWRIYMGLADKRGVTADALKVVKSAIDSAKRGTELLYELRGTYLDGLLDADRVDEGLAFLRGIVAEMDENVADFKERDVSEYLRSCLNLVRMARLLEKPDVVDEGFAGAEKAMFLGRSLGNAGSGNYSEYVRELLKQGRGAKAEEVIAAELVSLSKLTGDSRRSRSDVMTALAYVYNAAGRHEDVISLLEKGTMWDANDLSDLAGSSFDSKPMHLIAAESLHAVGRDAEATRLLERVLKSQPGKDAAYALLLEMGGDGIVDKLDGIHAGNRFEERPLIWKAKFLSDTGKLDEAEKTARAAIMIDPSDGEQGKGDRMRVYAVLAEIMDKKGDGKQADFLKAVVRSIRMSEDGDDWWYAGLRPRAIELYEASLKEFADAYCIQSRLALRYSESGDFEKAAEHYRRAFELMPESFGRVESHCFGCEGAFTGELAQGIAEKVFLRLAEEMPDRAQVFYLLGYLRGEQGRSIEAAQYYSMAVKIDPDYINAWKNLNDVSDKAGLSANEKDSIALAIFRLNPYGADLRNISELDKLWDTALEADKGFVPDETGPVFPLKESSGISGNSGYGYSGAYNRRTPPRAQITKHPEMSALIQLLEYLWRG